MLEMDTDKIQSDDTLGHALEKNETLPNQLNKQIKNPTMRWIFQLTERISVVR